MNEGGQKKVDESFGGFTGPDIEKSMTSEVIHDFKNILTGIQGNLDLAKKWCESDHPVYPFIEAAERVTKHAHHLSLQMLANAQRENIEFCDVSFARLVRNSLDLILGGSKCSYEVKIHPDLRMFVGDEVQITQVLNNILENARQAMPDGGSVKVKADNFSLRGRDERYQLDEGKYTRVAIEDSGTGIPEDLLNKIFKMNFTTKKDGNGIGLASCFHILKKHGGGVFVESKVGVGSTFTIFIPASEKVDPDAVVKEEVDVRGVGTILVLDDEKMVQRTVGDMLGYFGFDVEFADDGEEAVKRYENAQKEGKRYEMVIMDLTIPGGMGGLEALKRLHQIDPNVQAVVSSGMTNDPAMRDCQKFGFRGAIRKPYTLVDLQNIIHETINS